MRHFYYEAEQPVVETTKGKVRGFTYGGVHIFYGVPYAKAERYKMPQELEPWEGEKLAWNYADFPRQMTRPGKGMALYGIQRFWPESEDCHYVNIWAPKNDGAKRPVFVWMHGGGFTNGSASEAYTYDLFHMSVYGDVVCVSINARLGMLGFLNLEEYGEEFWNSGNLGIADLSAALKWIHENIAAFGGDPENVTICGQSGGGGKVRSMMGIEANKGYFQKAIVMSGCMGGGKKGNRTIVSSRENSKRLAKEMMDYLSITKDNIQEVYTVPYEKLLDAYKVAEEKLYQEGIRLFIGPIGNDYFRGDDLEAGYCDWAKDIPKMYGSVVAEFSAMSGLVPRGIKDAMTPEQQEALLNERFGQDKEEVCQLFAQTYPDHPVIDVVYLDTDTRISTMRTALMAAENGKNNTYVYMLSYDFPMEGGVPAFHCGDIPFAFHNIDKVPVANEEVVGERLQAEMFGAFMAFTKTGNPNHSQMAHWAPVTADSEATMFFDVNSQCKVAGDKALIDKIADTSPLPAPFLRMRD